MGDTEKWGSGELSREGAWRSEKSGRRALGLAWHRAVRSGGHMLRGPRRLWNAGTSLAVQCRWTLQVHCWAQISAWSGS